MISSLMAILGLLAVVSGLGAFYRVVQKRTTEPQPKSSKSGTPATPSSTSQPTSSSASASHPLATNIPKPEPQPEAPPLETTMEEPAIASASTETPMPSEAAPIASEESSIASEPALPVFASPVVEPEIAASLSSLEGVAEIATPIVVDPISPSAAAIIPPSPSVTTGADLKQTIAQWGQTGQESQIIPLLQYANHANPEIREAVAAALEKLAAKDRRADMERLVATLGKLSQDSQRSVRLQAIAALANVRSASVVPWLQRALKHPDNSVVKAASDALQRLKLQYSKYSKSSAKPVIRQIKNR